VSSLYTFVSKNVISVSDISAVNLIAKCTCLFKEFFYFLLACVTQEEHVVNISFPHKWFFCNSVLEFLFLFFAMKILAEATAIFVPMAVP